MPSPSWPSGSSLLRWARAASLSMLLLSPSPCAAAEPEHTSPLLYSVATLGQPLVEAKINGVAYKLVIDSGSPDTFVYAKGVTCIGPQLLPADNCTFTDNLYSGSFDRIDGVVFNQTYGSGQNLSGPFGYASIEVAGITVSKQRIAFVDRSTTGTFPGDGILGMAPAGVLEASWKGTNGSTVQLGPQNQVKYPTVFESMYNSSSPLIDKSFWSFALNRESSNGSIAFGVSVPEASNVSSWISTPLTSVLFGGSNATDNFYTIQPDGYELDGKRVSTDYPLVVDTGTFVNRLPDDIADKYNAAFDPPAVYNSTYQIYNTSCDAKVPDFALVIAGKVIKPSAKDMLQQLSPLDKYTCITGITKSFNNLGDKETFPKGFQVISDMFLNAVVTEFDVGKKEVRFGLREAGQNGNGTSTATTTTGPSSSASTSPSSSPTGAKSGAGRVAISAVQYFAIVALTLVL